MITHLNMKSNHEIQTTRLKYTKLQNQKTWVVATPGSRNIQLQAGI